VEKAVRLLVQDGVKVPADLRDQVAVCVGLKRTRKNCEWSVVAFLREGTPEVRNLRDQAAYDSGELGVAVVRLSPDQEPKPVQLVTQ